MFTIDKKIINVIGLLESAFALLILRWLNGCCRLGQAQCEIPLKKLKHTMKKDAISHLASYTMSHCRSKGDVFEENLQQVNSFVFTLKLVIIEKFLRCKFKDL